MQQENLSLEELKQEQIAKIEHRNQNGILEKENANFLIKLIKEAQNKSDVLKLSSLGMALKRTGFHFDVRLEKEDRTIKYFAKNENLSFKGKNALTHKLIIGDNYPALLNLLITHKGKIKVIYIDPPYGKDDLGDFAKTNYDNAITRDNLLSMLKPRLELARMLLRDDGVIFCSIDDKNQAYVKCLFDEVFGEREFVANIIWANTQGGGGSDSNHFRIKHEYILSYAKNIDNLKIFGLDIENTENYKMRDKYEKIRGKYQTRDLSVASLGYVESLDYPIEAPDGSLILANKNNEKISRWRWSKEKLEWGIKNDFVEFKKNSNGEWKIYTKIYLNCDNEGNITQRKQQPSSVIHAYSNIDSNKELKNIFDGKNVFDYSKPTSLIKHLLKISTNKPDFDSTNRGGDRLIA